MHNRAVRVLSRYCGDRRYLKPGCDGHVCFCVGHRSFRARAAGVTWTSRTRDAPWAARYGHTTVIDAAGAIYVIGGFWSGNNDYYLDDVWVSTDGGAHRTRGVLLLVLGGCSRGYFQGYSGVLMGY